MITPSVSPAALEAVRSGRRTAERNPSTTGRGIPAIAANRATQLERLGGRTPDGSPRTVPCLTPRSAGCTDPTATTANAMATATAARGQVIGGAAGAP